eukprot:RCo042976
MAFWVVPFFGSRVRTWMGAPKYNHFVQIFFADLTIFLWCRNPFSLWARRLCHLPSWVPSLRFFIVQVLVVAHSFSLHVFARPPPSKKLLRESFTLVCLGRCLTFSVSTVLW